MASLGCAISNRHVDVYFMLVNMLPHKYYLWKMHCIVEKSHDQQSCQFVCAVHC